MERQFRTQEECEPLGGTHELQSPGRETCKDMEGMRDSEGYSRPGEPRQGQVRTQKECKPARGTHILEPRQRDKSEHGMRRSESHSLPGESRQRNES